MQHFLSRRRNILIGAFLVLVAMGVLTAGRDTGGPVGRTIGVLGAPVQLAVSGAARWVGRMVDHYIFLVGAREEAERLRAEVHALRLELGRVEEYRLENERLNTLLRLDEGLPAGHVAAHVVGRSATAWYRTLVLDKGERDGVRVGAPVITSGGVVGRVYEVSGRASRVMLLTDASSAVDAIIQRSRVQVLVEGTLQANPRVLYLSRSHDAEPGDVIITSGLDGIYPKGLLLGRLTDIHDEPSEIFLSAKLTTSADFSRIEEVFILAAGDAGAP